MNHTTGCTLPQHHSNYCGSHNAQVVLLFNTKSRLSYLNLRFWRNITKEDILQAGKRPFGMRHAERILTCPQSLILCASHSTVLMCKVDKSFINALCVHQQGLAERQRAIRAVCPRRSSSALIPSFPSRIKLRIRGGGEIHNPQKHSVRHSTTQTLLPCTLTQ